MLVSIAASSVGSALALAADSGPPTLGAEADAAGVFAVVGGETVSDDQYRHYVARQMRRMFFHGGASAERVAQVHREAAQTLVDEVVLSQEARRRGLVADPQALASRVAALGEEKTGQLSPEVLKSAAERDLLVDQLRAHVRQGVAGASAVAVRDYYDTHRDKFVVPERVRVAVILLKVPPYAPPAQWEGAQARAAQLWREIHNGAPFGEIARRESQHESAVRGGDLGLVHKGMLTREIQEIVDRLAVGELAQPAPILQGIVIVRLEERQPPAPLSFEQARDRAQRLLDDENAERAWRDLLAQLRRSTAIELRE